MKSKNCCEKHKSAKPSIHPCVCIPIHMRGNLPMSLALLSSTCTCVYTWTYITKGPGTGLSNMVQYSLAASVGTAWGKARSSWLSLDNLLCIMQKKLTVGKRFHAVTPERSYFRKIPTNIWQLYPTQHGRMFIAQLFIQDVGYWLMETHTHRPNNSNPSCACTPRVDNKH